MGRCGLARHWNFSKFSDLRYQNFMKRAILLSDEYSWQHLVGPALDSNGQVSNLRVTFVILISLSEAIHQQLVGY
jgi:hypothetical protein